MRVLVTGGTGYLGRAVVRALAARGHELHVFARHATAAGLDGTAVDGDVRDADGDAERDLGYRMTPLANGVSRTLAALR